MTYQSFSKRIIQIALTLMLVLFAWISYHQFMSTMSMDSMPDCLTFCFIANNVDMSQLAQSTYYSFIDITSALLALLAVGLLAYLVLYYLRYNRPVINSLLQRLKWYYHQQSWRFKLFSLWSNLYQQGIIAPQVYS